MRNLISDWLKNLEVLMSSIKLGSFMLWACGNSSLQVRLAFIILMSSSGSILLQDLQGM